MLDVPPELEVAIAAALGEYIDSVILDKGVDHALDYLSSEHSRGILLPLGNLFPGQGTSPGTTVSEDFIGVGSDLVRCPEYLRPVVDLLLGRVLIVRDRRSARKLLSQRLDGERLVTLSGKYSMLRVPSIFSRGFRPGSSILGRTRQRKETESQAATAGKQLEKIDARLRAAEMQLDVLKVENDKMVAERNALESSWRAQQAEVHQLELAFERGVQKAEFLHQQVNGHGIELQQVAEETQEQERAQDNIGQELAKGKQELRSLQARLGEFSLDESGARASYWSTQLAMASARLASANERAEERRQTLDRLTATRELLERRRAELAADLEELAAARERLQIQEKQVGEKIKELQSQIDPAEPSFRNSRRTWECTRIGKPLPPAGEHGRTDARPDAH
jgi:chromosome segregation protein